MSSLGSAGLWFVRTCWFLDPQAFISITELQIQDFTNITNQTTHVTFSFTALTMLCL